LDSACWLPTNNAHVRHRQSRGGGRDGCPANRTSGFRGSVRLSGIQRRTTAGEGASAHKDPTSVCATIAHAACPRVAAPVRKPLTTRALGTPAKATPSKPVAARPATKTSGANPGARLANSTSGPAKPTTGGVVRRTVQGTTTAPKEPVRPSAHSRTPSTVSSAPSTVKARPSVVPPPAKSAVANGKPPPAKTAAVERKPVSARPSAVGPKAPLRSSLSAAKAPGKADSAAKAPVKADSEELDNLKEKVRSFARCQPVLNA
jgi:hypothetical protein